VAGEEAETCCSSKQGERRDKERRRACANYNNQDYNSNLLVSLAGCHSRGPKGGAKRQGATAE